MQAPTLTLSCRGYPEPPAGWRLLREVAARLTGRVLDASGLLGLPARAVPQASQVQVLEPSAAGLAALVRDLEREPRPNVQVGAGLPWDAAPASVDALLLAPPGERGSARVRAELAAAARALRPEGVAYLLLERDRGAKRYGKEATAWFGHVEIANRSAGFRLLRASAPRTDALPPLEHVWHEFDVPEFGALRALAGVFAASKLDPGSAELLRVLAGPQGPRIASGWEVLDLGCGWGPLALHAAAKGARVTAVDDDLAAVRSAAANLQAAGAAFEVVHADLDRGLAQNRTFDAVLVNPPFHLGAGVRMELGRAFLEAAVRRTRSGGAAWIVANAQLPYEATLHEVAEVQELARSARFKVLRARPHRTSR